MYFHFDSSLSLDFSFFLDLPILTFLNNTHLQFNVLCFHSSFPAFTIPSSCLTFSFLNQEVTHRSRFSLAFVVCFNISSHVFFANLHSSLGSNSPQPSHSRLLHYIDVCQFITHLTFFFLTFSIVIAK